MTEALLGLGIALLVGLAIWALRRRRVEPIARDAPTTPGRSPLGLGERLRAAIGTAPGPADWLRLEETLIAADMGVATATALVEAVRSQRPADAAAVRVAMHTEMVSAFASRSRTVATEGSPAVIVMIGVNGSGKTTTIAKLAARLTAAGHRVLLGAADTYRAGASEQLRTWAGRLGVEVVAGSPGADPAAVAHDAVAAARSRGCNVVIVDTAGRLHDKTNLMDELAKVVRVAGRDAGRPEVLLVLDGTTGQNGLAQARAFGAAVPLTGVVLSKLDGSSRGGIALAVERELQVPVKLVGLGEGVGDLRDFDPVWFVDSLLEGW